MICDGAVSNIGVLVGYYSVSLLGSVTILSLRTSPSDEAATQVKHNLNAFNS